MLAEVALAVSVLGQQGLMRHGLTDSARIISPVDRDVLVHDNTSPGWNFVPFVDDLRRPGAT